MSEPFHSENGRPPVIERVACFFADLPDDAFARNINHWIAECAEDFRDHVARPNISLEFASPQADDNRPIGLQPPSVKVQIKHWCVSDLGGNGKDACLVQPDGPRQKGCLSLSVVRGGDSVRSFHELHKLAQKWVPRWGKVFQVESLKRVRLHYVNLIRSDNTPELASKGEGVHVSKALTVFRHLPIPYKRVIDPLNWQVRLEIESELNCEAEIRIQGVDAVAAKGGGKLVTSEGVQVDFLLDSSPVSGSSIPCDDGLQHLPLLHHHATDVYRRVFTEEAMRSFSGS